MDIDDFLWFTGLVVAAPVAAYNFLDIELTRRLMTGFALALISLAFVFKFFVKSEKVEVKDND